MMDAGPDPPETSRGEGPPPPAGQPPPPAAQPPPPAAQPPPPVAPPPPVYAGPVPPGGWQQPPPQRAPVPWRLAGWGTRLAAYVVDGLIVFVPAVIIIVILGVGIAASDESGSDAGVAAFVVGLIVTILVVVAVSLLYAPLLMMRQGERNGQTIGKQLMNIRVIRTNGQPFTFGSAALREAVLKNLAVGVASSIIPIIPWFLNFFWPLWDEENRALHDMAADTRVVAA